MAVDLAALREWLDVSATSLDDEALQQVVDAESELQAAQCVLPTNGLGEPFLSASLVQALYRRVGREIAARRVPIGIAGLESESGPARMSRWDAEIDRLEGPFRVLVIG